MIAPRQTSLGRQCGTHLIVMQIHIQYIKQIKHQRRIVKLVNCMFQNLMSTSMDEKTVYDRPEGTRRQDRITSTSMRRHDVDTTPPQGPASS